MTRPVALTLGDPSGIGGEIALTAWAALAGRLKAFRAEQTQSVAERPS